MSAWWSDLSPRERYLLMIAGGLLLVLAFSFLILKPLGDWQADSKNRAASARDGYELVATAAAVSQPEEQAAPRNNIPLRQAITGTAQQREIVLVRIGAETNGQIEVQPEPTNGEALFTWLEELEKTYGVSVAFADMARNEDGFVNAQVLVFERQP